MWFCYENHFERFLLGILSDLVVVVEDFYDVRAYPYIGEVEVAFLWGHPF